MTLRVRWLGRVPYREALAVQQALFDRGREQHLLLLEHEHVFTYGKHADLDAHLRCDPAAVGADLVAVSRGGDITYHGPGQVVGYPILDGVKGSLRHVRTIEQLLIDVLADLGADHPARLPGYPGVWLGAEHPRKVAAIGVRLGRGRSMHGFALNVAPDLAYMRQHIVACGIPDRPVTSLAEEGIDVTLEQVVDAIVVRARAAWGEVERQDIAWRHTVTDLAPFSRGAGAGEPVRPRSHERLAQAGVVDGLGIGARKPEWLRPRLALGERALELKRMVRQLDLVTVCEDAGCPNLSECWSDGTATFMLLGERCTRACGFCLVDTRKPEAPDPDEPRRVAEAVDRLALDHAVLTMVARDDLADGGMAHVAACVSAIRARRPACRVETLISDAHGGALDVLFDARPDVLNHNVETVPRLQRAVRPSAGYARSLGVLARAKATGLVAKSGLMLGLGETPTEVEGMLADLAGIGVDIVTIGQYLRPTTHHLPVARWVDPAEFDEFRRIGQGLGIGHVEASPLTRSSYHAKRAAEAVDTGAATPRVAPAVPVAVSRDRHVITVR